MYAIGSPARRLAAKSLKRASISGGSSRSPCAITLASENPHASASSSRASRGSIPAPASACETFKSGRFLGELRQPLGLVGGDQATDQVVELAVEDALDLVQRQVDPMVGHTALREVVGADALRAVARADQRLAHRSRLRRDLALALVLDPRREHAERLLAVLVLRARILAFDDDPGRQ